MSRCLQLAKLGEFSVAPNPMVGCVIVHNQLIVAEGYHQKFGGPHAEVNAFSSLQNTIPISECEVYVSLEPCSHFGKTPPCADLIIRKKPRKVIVGMLDPNPQVAGSGVKKIRDASIEVEIGVLESECQALNKKFICYHSKKRPFITLKWAQTADGFLGRISAQNHLQKQISSTKNKGYVHQLRANHMAILVGSNTINADNPQLDTRHWIGSNPIKIVLAKSLNINLESRILKEGKTLIINGLKSGVEGDVSFVQTDDFSVKYLLYMLYTKGIQSILVEGGSKTLQAFIDSDIWDEAIVLTSKVTWGEGISAPKMEKAPLYVENRHSDQVTFYTN